jgi:hypothetical protein
LRRIGPPREPSKSFERIAGRERPDAFASQSFAFMASLLIESDNVARKSFEPERVLIATWAPGIRPNSGAKLEV